MNRYVAAIGLVCISVALAQTAMATTEPPGEPPPGDPELGTGPSGTGIVLPICGPLTSYNIDASGNSTGVCEPLASSAPTGATLLGNDGAACTVPAGTEMEGFFTLPDQMDTFFECWIPEMEFWLSQEYAGTSTPAPAPNGYVFVPATVHKDDLVGGCTFDDEAYQYCSLDGRIYVGEVAAWTLYNRVGDAAPVMGLAHELGHFLQQISGVRLSHPDFNNQQIAYENQADCVAGVFMDYVNSRGGLTAGDENVDDDILDLAEAMNLIQSYESEGDERDHGTLDQRMRAFYTGYLGNQGLNACNVFITDFTVLPTTGVQVIAPPPPAPAATVLPPATQQPVGLGGDPQLDALAQACFDGDMSACDSLYESAEANSVYQIYGDTCAGRQAAGTNRWCSDSFPSEGGTTTGTAPGTTPTTVGAFQRPW